MSVLNRFSISKQKNNHELQSSLVRLAIWGAASSHILISHSMGHFAGDFAYYLWTFGFYLFLFVGILISVLIRPAWPARRVVAMIIDVGAITIVFLPTGEAINPFSLLYLWLVVAYGARYGKKYLFYAAAGSAAAYSSVVIAQDLFITEPTETAFFLFFLLVLPVYQYMIISGRIVAEQATEVKNRFLSTMTHELRTPLSGVIGMSRLLDSTRLDNEQQEYVKSIQSASDVLMSLIGDILDFSKIEAKRLEINKVPFDTRECVGVVCQLLSNRAEEKHLELICRFDEDVPSSLHSDEIRVKQILYNLIGNAIKFTERGEVEVWASMSTAPSHQSPHFQIKVRDTGPGIPADKLERIFEGFWQENLSVTRKHGGTGLGTTISWELARMLGGDVDVTSTHGVGSTFRCILPLETQLVPAAPVTPQMFSEKTFLVIERNQSSFAAISNTLTAAGAKVLWKRDPQEIRGIAAVVLADDLDRLDLNLVAQSQMESFGVEVPVLVLGYASRQYSLDLPNWSFLPKPFIPQLLRAALSNLLDSQKSRSSANRNVSTSSALPVPQPKKVLIAEDEPINAKLIYALLTKQGHEATLVDNGIKALELLSERCFDLAILDVRMPEMGGIEVTRRLRVLEKSTAQHVPIVALTASAINDVKDACLSAGMDEFLLKPINPDLLDNLIERFTGSVAVNG